MNLLVGTARRAFIAMQASIGCTLDAHLLLADLHRKALLLAAHEAGSPFQGLSMAGKRLGLSNTWRRKLCIWDAALGLCEKISPQSVETHLAALEAELVRARQTSAVPTTVEGKHFDFGNAMPHVSVGSKVVVGKMEAVGKHVAAGEKAAAGEKVAAGEKAAAKIGDKVADGINPFGTQAGSSFVMTKSLEQYKQATEPLLESSCRPAADQIRATSVQESIQEVALEALDDCMDEYLSSFSDDLNKADDSERTRFVLSLDSVKQHERFCSVITETVENRIIPGLCRALSDKADVEVIQHLAREAILPNIGDRVNSFISSLRTQTNKQKL